MPKHSQSEIEDVKHYLRSILEPGTTIYTILRSVSDSGVSRRISACLARKAADDTIILMNLDYFISLTCGYTLSNKGDGLIIKGAGKDMGVHLVHSLGNALWPNGTPEPHGTRNGEPDSSGGYVLKQKWL